jgi:hypothetical protein
MAAPSKRTGVGGGGAGCWVALFLAAVALRPAGAVSEPTTVAFDVRPGGVEHSFSQNVGPGVRAAIAVPDARGDGCRRGAGPARVPDLRGGVGVGRTELLGAPWGLATPKGRPQPCHLSPSRSVLAWGQPLNPSEEEVHLLSWRPARAFFLLLFYFVSF